MNGIHNSKKRKRSYSGDEVRAALLTFESVKRFKKDHHGSGLAPMEIARAASGGASARQIRRWKNMDISDKARKQRLSMRATKAKISIQLQWLAVGFVLHRRLSLLVVHREHVVDFFYNYLRMKVHPEYISKLMKEYGLSMQTVLPRESRMADEKVVDDAVALIAEVRSEGWRPDNTFIMDETGAWSNVVSSKTYNPINSYANVHFLKLNQFFCFRSFQHFLPFAPLSLPIAICQL
jgi:hypothetical protein